MLFRFQPSFRWHARSGPWSRYVGRGEKLVPEPPDWPRENSVVIRRTKSAEDCCTLEAPLDPVPPTSATRSCQRRRRAQDRGELDKLAPVDGASRKHRGHKLSSAITSVRCKVHDERQVAHDDRLALVGD